VAPEGFPVSVENFDGNGLADQPSIIYSFDNDGETEIREISRAGDLDASTPHSPGDVIERESTKSDPTDGLPVLDLPGDDGLQQDDCGKDIPAFACLSHDADDSDGCGKPVYVGRTCGSPACSRDWPAAVKRNVVSGAGKLEGNRRMLYARHDGGVNIDFNHVVASPPHSYQLDSDEPLERTLLIIKTFLEEHWAIDGFEAIYHPYRIKKQYRKDQYEHGGAKGEGDMTWKDVLSEDDPYQYIKFDPHFHLFFAAQRKAFDYFVAEALEEQSGWVFHRITKDDDDDNRSVKNLDDLVHQLTYCYSHAGVREVGPRDEFASRKKGELHNCYIPDGAENETLAMFCDAAPKLLGVQFSNMNEATCQAEITEQGIDEADTEADRSETPESTEGCGDSAEDHPLYDVWNPGTESTTSTNSGGDPWPSGTLDAGESGLSDSEMDSWSENAPRNGSSAQSNTDDTSVSVERGETASQESEGDSSGGSVSPVEDAREPCGGNLRPMHEAGDYLDDPEWCSQAEYVSGLRDANAEWEALVEDESEKPWVDVDDDDDGLDVAGSVVRGD
jgi:hypothetical protein